MSCGWRINNEWVLWSVGHKQIYMHVSSAVLFRLQQVLSSTYQHLMNAPGFVHFDL